MRLERYDLNVLTVDTPGSNVGTAHDCSYLTNKVVVLRPGLPVGTTYSSTLQLQVCDHDTDDDMFIDYGPAVANVAACPVHVHGAWKRLRVKTANYDSGTPTATFEGDNHRAH